MDIVFCVNDAYVKYIAVSICSIFENNRDCELINIHLLTDGITESSETLLQSTISRYGGIFHKYIIDDSELKKLYSSRWSVYTWYRCYIPQVLKDVKSCLYLDADTIILGSISDLFNMPIEGKSIFAALDIVTPLKRPFLRLGYSSEKKYICAGVMMMNLEYWREHNLSDKIIDYAQRNAKILVMPDQDVINVVCQDSKVILPTKYGIQHSFFFNKWFLNNCLDELKDAISDPRIVHYAGCAPWYKELRVHFMTEFFDMYNKKMGNVVPIKYYLKGFKKFKYRLNDLLIALRLRKPREMYNISMVKNVVDSCVVQHEVD